MINFFIFFQLFSMMVAHTLDLFGGESGYEARPCHFDWVMEIRSLCVENNVSFWFKQTGAKFVKDGRMYHIKRQLQHSQARKAGINYKV